MLPAITFYALLFFAVLVLPAAMILAVLFFIEYERRLWQHPKPGPGLTALRGAGSRAAVQLQMRFPRTARFLTRRLDPKTPWGLPASLAAAVIFVGTWFFLGVLQDIAARDPLVVLDLRLHNVVPLFRTEGMTRFMLVLTQLGGAAVLILLSTGAALRALSQGQRRLAATWALALTGSGLVTASLKALFGFARPIDALIGIDQGSFPSGHMLSSTVVYGLFAALLLGRRNGKLERATGVALLLLLIVGIGLSRLYLGVHWPSDLLGSMALALILLAALLFFLFYGGTIRWVDSFILPRGTGALQIAGNLALALALPAAVALFIRAEQMPAEPPPPALPLDISGLRSAWPSGMPRWSEDLIGGRMEPVSLVLVGSRDEIAAAFTRAGWRLGDLPTPVRVMQEAIAALRNLPDPTGPATPAFVMDRPQGMTFEKQDPSDASIRRRHHSRLWQTQYCVAASCRPVWVATASFDVGIQLSEGSYLPTHRIDPELDAERKLIETDLTGVGVVRWGRVPVSPPMRGKNAAGDPFWTDGAAVVLVMP